MEKFQYFLQLIRFYNQTGTLLLLLPSLWGLFLYGNPNIQLVILYSLGAFLMRSAGCVINDICDRNFDKEVARTSNRPIASNKISVKNSIIITIILCLLAFAILLQLPMNTIKLGLLSPLLFIPYPLMKRITYYPQIFLGITFNYGILMGWSSVSNIFSISLILLYIFGLLWTLIYDTIYAFQDIEDDKLIGVKSITMKIENHPKLFFNTLMIIQFILLTMIGILHELNFLFYMIVIFTFFLQAYKINHLDFNNKTSCAKNFNFNAQFGLLILFAIIIGQLI